MENSENNINPDQFIYKAYEVESTLDNVFSESDKFLLRNNHLTITETIITKILTCYLGHEPRIEEFKKILLVYNKPTNDNIIFIYNGNILGIIEFKNTFSNMSKPGELAFYAEMNITFNPNCDREQITKSFFETAKCICCGRKVYNFSVYCDSCWKKELMGTFPTIPDHFKY